MRKIIKAIWDEIKEDKELVSAFIVSICGMILVIMCIIALIVGK